MVSVVVVVVVVVAAAAAAAEGSALGAIPPRPDKRTVIYGDSITQGVCASEVGKTYPDQLSQFTRVVNLGKSKQVGAERYIYIC